MIRTLSDETLIVFLSDCHIGGDVGRSIFETPGELVRLFDEIDVHPGPVELVLAGDFFDFLRIKVAPAGYNRASATISRPELAALFARLRQFAATPQRRVVYLPGNHDAEMWWNDEIRGTLQHDGLMHEFALSYAAAFASDPERVIYCEHGNEFDPANKITDYNDRLDTPLGEHIVTDIIPRLPHGRAAAALQLSDIDRVFPLSILPEWVAGRLFYALVRQAVRWLLLPLAIAYVAFEMIAFLIGTDRRSINTLFVDVTYDVLLLLVAFSFFFLLARRMTNRALRTPQVHRDEQGEANDATVAVVREFVESGRPPPLGADVDKPIAVFVSGHTHAPSLTQFNAHGGMRGVLVNSGCWLRQLQALRTYFRLPTVFISRFVLTHVRVYREGGATRIELWEQPHPSKQELRIPERLAVLGRLPREPAADAPPRVRASASV